MRLASGKRRLQQLGYSQEAADRIAAPQAKSTQGIYQSKWKIFADWCQDKGIIPEEVSKPQLSDFFLFLFHDRNLKVTTLKGYRSSIVQALVKGGRADLKNTDEITDLLQSLGRDRPDSGPRCPNWDLEFVLWSLTEPPFEPISKAPLQYVSWKALFLLLLASGARRAEVHAIDYKTVEHSPGWATVVLHPVANFLHKTQVSRSGVVKKPKVITFSSLKHLCSEGMEVERTLCPARALKQYLCLTQGLRAPGERTLFVSYDKPRHHNKAVHKNTLSSWVKNTLKHCYKNASDRSAQLVGARAHDLRGMATTLAFQGNVEMEEILQAGSWASPNTFISHYLKQMVLTPEGRKRLGPIVAAQQIV